MRDVTSCEEAVRLLAEYLDGELDGEATRGMTRHLRTCRGCYSRAEFERRLKDQLAALRESAQHDGFEARMRILMRSFAAAAQPSASEGGESHGRHHD